MALQIISRGSTDDAQALVDCVLDGKVLMVQKTKLGQRVAGALAKLTWGCYQPIGIRRLRSASHKAGRQLRLRCLWRWTGCQRPPRVPLSLGRRRVLTSGWVWANRLNSTGSIDGLCPEQLQDLPTHCHCRGPGPGLQVAHVRDAAGPH